MREISYLDLRLANNNEADINIREELVGSGIRASDVTVA